MTPVTVAQFALDRTCRTGHQVHMDDWTAEILPMSRAIVLRATRDIAPTALPDSALEAAQKALDALSMGGGAYGIPNPRAGRLLWSQENGQPRLRVSHEIPLIIPGGIVTMAAGQENIHGGQRGPGKYHDALRYFRMSQMSSDVFSAFHQMFLCFELMLSERVPLLPKEREVDWIPRALDVVVPTYHEAPLPEQRREFWKDFTQRVYKEVRCMVNHAKKGKSFLLPSKPADVAKVEWGLQVVTEHVMELGRPLHGFPATARPLMDHELAATGGYVGPTPLVALLCVDANDKRVELPWWPMDREPDREEPGIAFFAVGVNVEPDALPPSLHLAGLKINAPLCPPEAEFAARFPLDGVRFFEVEVALNFRMDQNIRTIFIHRG